MKPKERPLLMCAPMVIATLEGRKTQTRRLSGNFDVGMRLWVKETWQCFEWLADKKQGPVCYRATDEGRCCKFPGHLWRPSIFMPRWASRITLEVIAVRRECLQTISESDAKAEGITELPLQEDEPGAWWSADCTNVKLHARNPISAYQKLWDSLNGKMYPWVSNPEVTVVTFKRIKP